MIAAAALAIALVFQAATPPAPALDTLDLAAATVVISPGATGGESVAADVLREEIRARTGIDWSVASTWPDRGTVVAIARAGAATPDGWPADVPDVAARPEGYRIVVRQQQGLDVVWIAGADRRGLLFGVGGLLRVLSWDGGTVRLPRDLDVSTAPRYAIRGHQLGYRHHSNTYDGWTAAQYDQYIRELALAGANAVENIPFQDTRPAPLMPLSRAEMNRRVSEICAKYGLDYWLWMPVDFSLSNQQRSAAALARMDALFADSPRLDAIFVPGGDPGDNPAQLVVPFLEQIAMRLRARHPGATVWLSLQHFDASEIDFVFAWIDRERPAWLGGLIAGPGSYSLRQIRQRLDRRYRVRDYPDIGHTVRCQYPVPAWDPAFAFTLGREPINPRPMFYARVHDRTAPYTDGFISYSDGVNDDFNKFLWTRKAWDPALDVRAIAVDYARSFFGPAVAARAADGLLALERNWDGPLAPNGSVDATLALWQQLEAAAPGLSGNWRWQMYLFRAYYDAYIRHRLIDETRLEEEANGALEDAPRSGAIHAMARATTILDRATTAPCCRESRTRLETLADALFRSIRMQTSVPKYSASGYERGAVMDFVDHPLNNRWWLEDEFAQVRKLPDERARLARLAELRTWADPGPGGAYDDVGNIAASAHVRNARGEGDPDEDQVPHFTWKGGPTRVRLSWLTSLRWPSAITYEHLDRTAEYAVQLHVITDKAAGRVELRIDGQPARPLAPATRIGDRLAFRVPAAAVADGRVVLTFDPIDESRVNWRQYSRLVEAWLIRKGSAPAARDTR